MTDRSNPWPIVWTPFLERLVRRLTSGRGGVSVGGNFVSGTLTPLLTDGATPATVANVSATAKIQAVWLKWDANTETDMYYYEVWRHTSDSSGSASKIVEIYTTAIIDGNVTANQVYYYWVKAVDQQHNTSGFSSTASATPRDVGTTDVQDSAIEVLQLATDAVEELKIAADAVTAAKINVSGLDGTSGDVAANHIIAGMIQSSAITTVKLNANSVTAAKITVASLGAIVATLGTVVAGTVTGTTITGGTFRTASSGRRIKMDSDGIKFMSASPAAGKIGTTGNGGDNIVIGTTGNGGDNEIIGSGYLVRFYNMSNGVPFYVQSEQTVADIHYFNRANTPSGAAEVGDTCVVQGKHETCTVAGTPGTWVVTGDQAA